MLVSRRELLAAASVAAMIAAFPAAAQEHGGGGEAAAPDEKEVARSVELGGLVFPVFDEKYKLKNYLFVSARMVVAQDKDPWKYREQSHFIRDAVIRASHRISFNLKGNYRKLDEKLAAAECLKAANDIVGEPGAMVQMIFTQIASQD